MRSRSVPRSRGHDRDGWYHHQLHPLAPAFPSLPLIPLSTNSSGSMTRPTAIKMNSIEKRRETYDVSLSARGTPPRNIFAEQGSLHSRSASANTFRSNSHMVEEGRNPSEYRYRADDEYLYQVGAEVRDGHRRTRQELLAPRFSSPPPLSPTTHRKGDSNASFASDEVGRLEKKLAMKESEINELKRNNMEKEFAMKTASYKHLEKDLASKTSEIHDLKHQLSSMKKMSEDHLKAKLGQKESKLLEVFKAELERCKQDLKAEHEVEVEALQQELADAVDEIKVLKRGCDFVEQEAKLSSRELEEICHQNEEILEEIALLRRKNEELSAENSMLKERYESALQDKIEYEQVAKELRVEVEDTLIERTQLEDTMEELGMEFQQMVDKNDQTKNELEEAWRTNDKNVRRCLQLQKELDQLQEEKRIESQLNHKVKEQRDKIGFVVEDQQSEIRILKEENELLRSEMDEMKSELLSTLDVASMYQKNNRV